MFAKLQDPETMTDAAIEAEIAYLDSVGQWQSPRGRRLRDELRERDA